jgi:hypothetical protein
LARRHGFETASRTRAIAPLDFCRDADAIFPHFLILAKMCRTGFGFCVSIFKCRN